MVNKSFQERRFYINMEWSSLYSLSSEPSLGDIAKYIGGKLWGAFNAFIQETYKTEPVLSYSKCAGQPGWNVKYRKNSKSLCTLYPMKGFFIALVVIGNKEAQEAELMLPTLSEYTRELHNRTRFSAGGRWLMIHVKSPEILEDAKRLIAIRANTK